MRWFLTDDSAAEQRAVRLAFPGLQGGETEVSHLFCMVHSERTLTRRFNSIGKDDKVYKYLLAALKFRRLEATCKESIKAAMKATRNDADFN